MIKNKFICFVCGWSIHPKKNDGNLASCATRNAAVSRHFFWDGYFHPQTKKLIHSLKKKVNFVNSSLNEGLSPSGIALSFYGFGSFHGTLFGFHLTALSFSTFVSYVQPFRPEHH
jgi:hypothetical protein